MTGQRIAHVVADTDHDRKHYAGAACPCHPEPCLRSVMDGAVVYLHKDPPPVTVRRVERQR